MRTSAGRDADPGSVAVRANAEGGKESIIVDGLSDEDIHTYFILIDCLITDKSPAMIFITAGIPPPTNAPEQLDSQP